MTNKINPTERKKLIWKYFWKRKRQEIWDAKWILLAVQMIIFFTVGMTLSASSSTGQSINYSLGLLFGQIVIGELMIILLSIIGYFIIKWLKSNWELATEDANEELDLIKRRRGNQRSWRI